ncbi:MAG: hypothetical protein U0350_09330 [Caldilineaceae bacterium]
MFVLVKALSSVPVVYAAGALNPTFSGGSTIQPYRRRPPLLLLLHPRRQQHPPVAFWAISPRAVVLG